MQPNPNQHWQEDDDELERRLEVLPPAGPNNWVRRLKLSLLKHWNPVEIQAPKVDPELPDLNGVERSAEVFRFTALHSEHWLSPKGFLREWVRFNAKVFMLLLIPSLLVVPLITFTLGQFLTWTALIVATTSSMILFPLSALLVVGLISALVYLAKSFLMMRQRDERRRLHEDRYY